MGVPIVTRTGFARHAGRPVNDAVTIGLAREIGERALRSQAMTLRLLRRFRVELAAACRELGLRNRAMDRVARGRDERASLREPRVVTTVGLGQHGLEAVGGAFPFPHDHEGVLQVILVLLPLVDEISIAIVGPTAGEKSIGPIVWMIEPVPDEPVRTGLGDGVIDRRLERDAIEVVPVVVAVEVRVVCEQSQVVFAWAVGIRVLVMDRSPSTSHLVGRRCGDRRPGGQGARYGRRAREHGCGTARYDCSP